MLKYFFLRIENKVISVFDILNFIFTELGKRFLFGPIGLLPVYSNQKTNAYLKEIAKACGIYKNISFHTARHTFATTVTLSNGVPIETVSKMLGHTKLSTTQIYARVLENKIGEDMKNLTDQLKRVHDKHVIGESIG